MEELTLTPDVLYPSGIVYSVQCVGLTQMVLYFVCVPRPE